MLTGSRGSYAYALASVQGLRLVLPQTTIIKHRWSLGPSEERRYHRRQKATVCGRPTLHARKATPNSWSFCGPASIPQFSVSVRTSADGTVVQAKIVISILKFSPLYTRSGTSWRALQSAPVSFPSAAELPVAHLHLSPTRPQQPPPGSPCLRSIVVPMPSNLAKSRSVRFTSPLKTCKSVTLSIVSEPGSPGGRRGGMVKSWPAQPDGQSPGVCSAASYVTWAC